MKDYFIVKKNDMPPRTHNLPEILEIGVPEDFLTIARELTPEFIITRYPDAAGGIPTEPYDERYVKEILEKAERLFG